ncbi:MAG: TetR/AcrR family transcriptional regulator [Myxococcales bacterium]|nr:TetR/AcrR family transcriptional regulator [Myxococcales bacterium]
MARNRPDRTHEDKAAEIVAIAGRLFLEDGYDRTPIAAIAREAGIATNVVHWYFATKDELFVAVLEALQSEDLKEAADRLARSARGREAVELEALLTEFVWRRLDRYGLIATLHERSHHSPALAEFHEHIHRRYAEYLGQALDRCGVPAADRKLVVQALITAVEGLVMHRASKREAKRMMSFLAKRLIDS